MIEWQQRVVDEKTELDAKLIRLQAFIDSGAVFGSLSHVEKGDLIAQAVIMTAYSGILAKRIAAFK